MVLTYREGRNGFYSWNIYDFKNGNTITEIPSFSSNIVWNFIPHTTTLLGWKNYLKTDESLRLYMFDYNNKKKDVISYRLNDRIRKWIPRPNHPSEFLMLGEDGYNSLWDAEKGDLFYLQVAFNFPRHKTLKA